MENNIRKIQRQKSRKLKIKSEKIKARIGNAPDKHDPELLKRTIFVGNVNISTTRKKLKIFFEIYGLVETVRLRGIPVENINVSKKEAITMKKLHPKRKSIFAYVQFADEESAQNALSANGEVLQEHHLKVDKVEREENSDAEKISIFIGNLSFDIEEEAVWKFFDKCDILSVRIVRSSTVGAGKGFGFVNFKDKKSLSRAMKLDGMNLKGRPIRIRKSTKKPKLKDIDQKSSSSILKHDKPEQLKNKMDMRIQKLKSTKEDTFVGTKSLPAKERRELFKQKKTLKRKSKEVAKRKFISEYLNTKKSNKDK